jgi:DNA-binding GntR family transcriptional regulator
MSLDDRTITGATPRLYQRAFDILARQIREGVIAPGVCLLESGVAQQFGISRAPARRALEELARSGLLEKSDSHGYLVRGTPHPQPAAESGFPAAAAQSATGAPRLQAHSTWEKIYGEVEREIVARIAFASWRVNEARLARAYGVSRTVTRDVIGRLQQHGLLCKDDSARWIAPALTPDHVRDLYELRWVLEPVALEKAVPRLPRNFLRGLRDRLEDAIDNATVVPSTTLDSLEEDIHVDLLGYCGSESMMRAITLPQSLLVAHRFLYRETPDLFGTEPFLPEHMEIVSCLERQDAPAAAKALELHLRIACDRAIARVDVIRQAATPQELPYLEQL